MYCDSAWAVNWVGAWVITVAEIVRFLPLGGGSRDSPRFPTRPAPRLPSRHSRCRKGVKNLVLDAASSLSDMARLLASVAHADATSLLAHRLEPTTNQPAMPPRLKRRRRPHPKTASPPTVRPSQPQPIPANFVNPNAPPRATPIPPHLSTPHSPTPYFVPSPPNPNRRPPSCH